MTRIVAFSGRKQAGKNTAANFMLGIELVANELTDSARIDEKGRLITKFDFGGEVGIAEGVFDACNRSKPMTSYLSQNVWPIIKFYSFADVLKEICCVMFNIPEENLWGTDEQKNQPIQHILWKNMPGVSYMRANSVRKKLEELGFVLSEDWTVDSPMTGREILQYVGTEVFRCIYFNCHAESCLKRILQESPDIAVITDLRFENEIDEVKKYGGKVIRLTRKLKEDGHASEVALSDQNDKYDFVIDNHNMSIPEQNEAVYKVLVDLGVYQEEAEAGE